MPDIREPNSLNPIWPTKPGKSPGKRKQPVVPEKEKGQRKQRDEERPDDRPHIDDYA